jgi:hypothetical protein
LRRLRAGEYRGGDHGEGCGERAGDRGIGDDVLGIHRNFPLPAILDTRSHGAEYGSAIGLPDNPTSGRFKPGPMLMLRASRSSNYRRPDHDAVNKTHFQL